MLKTISLKFTEVDDPVEVPTQGVTIFVGPNNSGKSLVLRELDTAVSTHGTVATKILRDFQLEWPDETQLNLDISTLKTKSPAGMPIEHLQVGRFHANGRLETNTIERNSLINQWRSRDKIWFSSQFLRFFSLKLDGKTRFDLTNDRDTGDLISAPHNVLSHLFQDDDLRQEIRSIVHDAFGVYLVIDPLMGGQLRLRLSTTEPDFQEQSLAKPARDFHGKAIHIKEASDGVQAFIGILIAVRSGDYRLILIDEPEAFLHPPLARKLGFQLTTIASKNGGSLLASTHSADFLMGCLQASPNVRVVRLEYSNGKSKGRIVDAAHLTKLFRTPLMRSANVISSLFHDGVVVTESDNDRAFYSEIYHRLAEIEKGTPSILFVNAQNKQTIKDIIGPLRTFGVPAAAIADIDILKDGGGAWTGWLTASQLPQALHNGLGQFRGDILKRFVDLGFDMKRGGVGSLPEKDKKAANELFDTLAQHGVFVTRKGELENWLANLNVGGKKTEWTIAMLERLGSDPSNASYIQPAADDVWDFMRSIIAWIKNPGRKGTV